MVWVGMSRGRFVGGRNVKVPLHYTNKTRDKYLYKEKVTIPDRFCCCIRYCGARVVTETAGVISDQNRKGVLFRFRL
jgi:hypothetical protein